MRLRAAMIGTIRLRISTEEKNALCMAASKRGITLSEYIREVTIKATQQVAA
jgi:uncharacterized protein (DUF1778 family)